MQESLAFSIYHYYPRRLRFLCAFQATALLFPLIAVVVDADPILTRLSTAHTPPHISSILSPRRPQESEDESSPKPLFPGYAGPDPKPSPYLPAQIGGIVGAYAVTLVIVAILLLSLSSVRKRRLKAAEELNDIEDGELQYPTFQEVIPQNNQGGFPPHPSGPYPLTIDTSNRYYPPSQPQSPRNFSYPNNNSPSRTEHSTNYIPSPVSTILAPGVDLSVDQSVVATDRQMAQQQLEDMYKLVMEQEAAKEAGVVLDSPVVPGARHSQQQQPELTKASTSTLAKKEKRGKPANLDLGFTHEKKESKASSFFASLKSPRKKKVQGINISSPIMTPMSGTFPRGPEGQEMSTIPPRQYAPAAPPPIPHYQYHHSNGSNSSIGNVPRRAATMPLTPEMSPQSTQSIDGRIGAQLMSNPKPYREQQEQMELHLQHQYRQQSISSQRQLDPYGPRRPGDHSRNVSSSTSEADPVSAASDKSTTPLVGLGLPLSPKPNVTRFPADSLRSLPSSPRPGASFSLPLSPKPGASFSRSNVPSAVRTGGALPLRAYEPALQSPNAIARTTKETTFERTGPMSPGGGPLTGAAVPYSPYQPFSPVIPMTPSLVIREDRRRMRRLEPKTPTLEMVKNAEDIW
ncbi:hypothetical protein MCOR20_008579 [Pyricularia oryzae]|nr:hypothetical protein MCOR20_008579 [Pyricularia oryzae]